MTTHNNSDAAVHIAILEDDPVIIDILTMTLDESGWGYSVFSEVQDINRALDNQRFDLLLLDWRLPDGDAGDVIRLARSQLGWEIPILIESRLDDEDQIVRALEIGADDYVVKPLRVSEIKARISAMLRRSRRSYGNAQRIGNFQLDSNSCSVSYQDEPIALNAREFELISYFFNHKDELLSRDRLLMKVWNKSTNVDTRTVDTHVSWLRTKLNLGPESGLAITTVRGHGYRLEEI